MTVNELQQILSLADGEKEVVIQVELYVPTFGPTPSVSIQHVNTGFDWNNGKLIIVPTQALVTR